MSVRIEASYKVVTPMFCSGADPKKPELRLSSFKGVLRYWWRALAWSRLGGDLTKIRSQEDDLFGSSRTGQSRILLRLAVTEPPVKRDIGRELTTAPRDSRVVGEGARYLGYGVMEAFASRNKGTKAGELTRACFLAPFEFTVHLLCRNLDANAITPLLDSLKTLGMLGGMGAKSRNGYGSLVVQSLKVDGEQQDCPQTMDDLNDAIAGLGVTDNLPAGLPEYTAFSQQTRHVLLTSRFEHPLELLDLVGREMIRYRSWGNHGWILDGRVRTEGRFIDDHDLVRDLVPGVHPRRVAFGLPHNYSNPPVQVGPYDTRLNRRASPLFVHMHECQGRSVAVLSFLPARFLPEGRSDISVGGVSACQVPECELYRPVQDFLDRLIGASEIEGNRRVEPFTEALEVARQ